MPKYCAEVDFRGFRTRGRGQRENGEHAVIRTFAVFQCVCELAESQPGALKWAESSGGVGIVSTVVPVGTFSRPF